MQEVKDAKILEMLSNDSLFDKGFELLVQKYQERLYWHIRNFVHFHQDADDVLQNTFIKVFRSIKGFESKSTLFTWMYRIATNESLNYIKKNKKHVHSNVEEHLNEFELKLKADPYFDGDAAQLALLKAISKLPLKQKTVFNMRYFDELSYADISEVLDTSIGSLKASFHHAMKKVESFLKENQSYV